LPAGSPGSAAFVGQSFVADLANVGVRLLPCFHPTITQNSQPVKTKADFMPNYTKYHFHDSHVSAKKGYIKIL
jgi:hypothetical protein